ncbi:MAG: diaminopimelate decarboxylase [Candidatus Marinimicrobia bacterium]|nr:diaminopimelate decarboxylase [Candidatus Neomarinimicrobiota bacterium]
MPFHYINDRLHCDSVDLETVAKAHDTPSYVYSEAILHRNASVLKSCFIDRGFKVSYAMKANSNPVIMQLFKSYGIGVDIVSGGELQMARYVGFHGSEINYAGVGKTTSEIVLALEADIAHFNVESEFELELLNAKAAESAQTASVLLRLNPDIDPQTHPHISTGLKNNKFGMGPELIATILAHPQKYPNVDFAGLHCHIGSQILKPQPFDDLIDYLALYSKELKNSGITIRHIDFGGGFGVNYSEPFEDILTTTPYLESFADKAMAKLGQYQLHIQPGRVLVANSAVLLAQVLGCKENGEHQFMVIDGATTDLIRPALYNAYHGFYPHQFRANSKVGDVVGPVCESSDALVKDRALPDLASGELVAIASAGAYASSMGSTYNLRPLSPEILVNDRGELRLIRRRQTFEEMIALYRED